MLDTEDAILPIPLTIGLDALSPYTLLIISDNCSIVSTNEFNHTRYDFSIDYNYQLNMDEDNVLDIKRDEANPRVLLYSYDKNFGKINSLQINDVIIVEEDLSECFKIESTSTCVIEVPQEYQLTELHVVATNIWNGTASTILPVIDETTLNPTLPDPKHLIFDGVLEPWVTLVFVFTLMILVIFWIIKKYKEQKE